MNTFDAKPITTGKRVIFSPIALLRISMGIVYLWFGALKFFNGVSPAEQLAMQTIHKLTFGLINDHTNLLLLAVWETAIGLLLISGKYVKTALYLLFPHMICTFTPFIFNPQDTFRFAPYGLTLVGQYIIKNIIIISAALVIWKEEKEQHGTHGENASGAD
ncbi:MAG: hypothetical protein KGO92_05900 [Bacteroidota bacterium]|nr:hypothetical protein [Bacteroidota bacterium]